MNFQELKEMQLILDIHSLFHWHESDIEKIEAMTAVARGAKDYAHGRPPRSPDDH